MVHLQNGYKCVFMLLSVSVSSLWGVWGTCYMFVPRDHRLIYQSASTLILPGVSNVVVDRGQHGKY